MSSDPPADPPRFRGGAFQIPCCISSAIGLLKGRRRLQRFPAFPRSRGRPPPQTSDANASMSECSTRIYTDNRPSQCLSLLLGIKPLSAERISRTFISGRKTGLSDEIQIIFYMMGRSCPLVKGRLRGSIFSRPC